MAKYLLDPALPVAERAAIDGVLARYAQTAGIATHAVRTRQAGARRFIAVHVLVPGDWTVRRAHALLEALEHELRSVVPNATVFTHWDDLALDRIGIAEPGNGATG